jgi:hypothetical protein
MTTKTLEYPRDPTLLKPLNNLLKIKTRGTKWKRQMTKHNGRHGDGQM